jgi:hypothetical protein
MDTNERTDDRSKLEELFYQNCDAEKIDGVFVFLDHFEQINIIKVKLRHRNYLFIVFGYRIQVDFFCSRKYILKT